MTDAPAYWLTQEAVLEAVPDGWTATKDIVRTLTGRTDRCNAVRRSLGRLRAKGLVEQRRAAHGTGVEWRRT